MRAVYITSFGGPDTLEIRDVPDPPRPGPGQALVRVRAAGLNRADLLQRRGLYPPPEGYSPNIPGLEFAGEVVKTADTGFKAGDQVFGITAGAAQAEFLLSDVRLLVRIPDQLSFVEAAAVPEAFITAHDAVFTQGELKQGETLLVHAVGSGVGLAAVQLARAAGVRTFGTSRTADKLDRARKFGLDEGMLTADDADFAEEFKAKTPGGADMILDLVGGAYFTQNLECLAMKGRLLLVGLVAGRRAEIDLGLVLSRRIKIIGTVLRSRPADEKAAATERFARDVVPLLKSKSVAAVVDRVFSFKDVSAAHEYLESNESFGKVVLEF
jgi:NADPH:quinone reductase